MYSLIRDGVGLGHLPGGQRTAAVGLIIIQSQLLAMLMKPHDLPVLLLALAGWFAPQFRLLIRLPLPLVMLPVISFYLLRTRFTPSDFSVMGFIGTEVAFEVASCCITLQLLMLFLHQYAERLPIWLLAISGTGAVFGADIRIAGQIRAILGLLVAAYFIFWAMYAATSRVSRPAIPRLNLSRWVIAIGALGLALMLGRQGADLFFRHENQLERVISDFIFATDTSGDYRHGFSGTGGLSDMTARKFDHGDQVALEVDADFKPDYLRGKAFDLYFANRWHVTGETRTLIPREEGVQFRNFRTADNLFAFPESLPEDLSQMTVWPLEKHTSAHCFAPLNTVGIVCDSPLMSIDINGILERLSDSESNSYLVLMANKPLPQNPPLDPKFLQLPLQMHPAISKLAHSLCDGLPTTQAKIEAVTSFLISNFRYGEDINLPRKVDRLAFFLQHRLPAHCEYFATASAILLRVAGVPTRYVTGYVITGTNPVDGRWVARRRDSHAWAEAYDSELDRWVTVEATPALGIPAQKPAPAGNILFEAAMATLMRLQELFASGAFWNLARRLLQPALAMLLVLAAGYLLFRRYGTEVLPRFLATRNASPIARERISLDRFLARRGFVRRNNETLSQFADRLEREARFVNAAELAGWYRRYTLLRFKEEQADEPDLLQGVRQDRIRIIRSTRTAP